MEFLESDWERFVLQFSILLASICGLCRAGNASVKGDLKRIIS